MSVTANTLAVGAAMDWEVDAVLSALRKQGSVRSHRHGLWRGDAGSTNVVVYRTGVGIKSARRKTRDLIRETAPYLVINTGCAGALEEGWKAGDLAVADVLLGPPPSCAPWHVNPKVHETICEIACSSAKGGARTARAITSRVALVGEAEKRAHGQEHAAQLVEMEGAGVAQAASGESCAFASVRVILDPVGSELPELVLPDPHHRSRARRIARSLLSPTQTYRAALLYRNSRRTRAVMSQFCEKLFNAAREGTIDPDLLSLR